MGGRPVTRPSRGGRLLHFLLLGCLLFALEAMASRWIKRETAEEIAITPSRIEALHRDFQSRTGTLPDRRELAALVRDYIDREILFREALRHGLHRGDPVVRRRLTRNMEFAGADASGGPRALDAALALGMERSDPVVRRRLVQRAEQMLAASARSRGASRAELDAHLKRHVHAFVEPARYRFAHVFLSGDRRGAALERDAEKLLDELRSQRRTPDEIADLGDPFPLPRQLGPWSRREIAKQLGPGFAREIEALGSGQWMGPVVSTYGRHLVWLLDVTPATLPSLDELRSRLELAVREEHRRAARERGLDALRPRYTVRVIRGAAPAKQTGAAVSAAPGRGSAP